MEKYVVFDIETTGLRPQESRITCICAKDSNGKKLESCGNNEYDIISEFIEFLEHNGVVTLISANGKDFDIPFILARMLMINMAPGNTWIILSRRHFDIINDITDKKISLDNLARLYGFQLKTGYGTYAIDLFNANKFLELGTYCMNDVLLTEKIYLKYLELNKEVKK